MIKKPKKRDLIVKVPLAQIGKWWNPKFGLISFSLEHFEAIIENFKANILGHPPYLTYGHLDEEPSSIDSHRKRGDLIDLRISDKTLFGYFKVKPLTYRFIKNGEYEFSSVEYLREGYDKNTKKKVGTLLQRVALTNSPFIPFTNTKAIALSNNIKEKGNKFCVSSTIAIENTPQSQYNSNNNFNSSKMKTSNNPASVIPNDELAQTLKSTIERRVTKQNQQELNNKDSLIRELESTNKELLNKLQVEKSNSRQRAQQLLETRNLMGKSIQSNFAATLLSQGIAKPTVNKCLLLLDAHSKNSNVVSLSDGQGKVTNVGIPQLLNQIIEDLLSSEKVDLSVSGSLAESTSDYGRFNGGYIDQELARFSQD